MSALTPIAPGLGNRNDQARRHNLSTVLTLLNQHGALTRAELTRSLGVNRTTIGTLVTELTELGLAFETGPTEQGGVGRPSATVNPNSEVVAVTVNPDTDAMIVGLVGLGGRLHKRVRIELAHSPSVEETVRLVAGVVADVRAKLKPSFHVLGVGIAVPGLVQPRTGIVTLAPHLQWRDERLGQLISTAVDLPTTVGNDANLAVLAESIYGAGRGVNDLVYLNGSASGIGGGVIVGGTLLLGAHGYAAELGHTPAIGGRVLCHCGRYGCLESEVRFDRLVAVLDTDAADEDELDTLLATSTDPLVHAEVERQIDVLSHSLANFVGIFNPESIVLGGYLGSLFTARPDKLLTGVKGYAFGNLGERVRIERAELGSSLLMIGAAQTAFQALLSDPAGVMGRR